MSYLLIMRLYFDSENQWSWKAAFFLFFSTSVSCHCVVFHLSLLFEKNIKSTLEFYNIILFFFLFLVQFLFWIVTGDNGVVKFFLNIWKYIIYQFHALTLFFLIFYFNESSEPNYLFGFNCWIWNYIVSFVIINHKCTG